MAKVIRWGVATVAAMYLALVVLHAQAADPSTAAQISLLDRAIEKGGAWVIVLGVLFFYRRDYKVLTDTLVELVIKNTEAQTKHTAALEENTRVVHSTKDFMRRYTPEPGFWEAEERRADANARREADKLRRGNGEALT